MPEEKLQKNGSAKAKQWLGDLRLYRFRSSTM